MSDSKKTSVARAKILSWPTRSFVPLAFIVPTASLMLSDLAIPASLQFFKHMKHVPASESLHMAPYTAMLFCHVVSCFFSPFGIVIQLLCNFPFPSLALFYPWTWLQRDLHLACLPQGERSSICFVHRCSLKSKYFPACRWLLINICLLYDQRMSIKSNWQLEFFSAE